MGKGDIKTKRGKIANKSYGARRKRKIKKRTSVDEKVAVEKVKKG
ncbi:30S ribosomal protein THX [uncultured Croceitalea sp.]